MLRYMIKRILLLIPVILGVTALVFFIMSLSPGDPALTILGPDAEPEAVEVLREKLGLNDPVIVQYGRWLWNSLHGDLGTSYASGRPVLEEYFHYFPNTFRLTCWSMLIAVLVSLPLGIVSAVKQYSLIDNVGTAAALVSIAIPDFWQGLMSILIFAVFLDVLPAGGATEPGAIILPAVTLGTGYAAAITRYTRSSMLETVRQDYIRTARAKGVNRRKVITGHALRNALLPVVTIICMDFGYALAGAATTEIVFSWPGIGRLTVNAINAQDRPLALGCLIMTAILICISNMVMDLLYAVVDPRIKLTGGKAK